MYIISITKPQHLNVGYIVSAGIFKWFCPFLCLYPFSKISW